MNKLDIALLTAKRNHYVNWFYIDAPLIYADYYFLEALLRYKKFIKK